MLLVLAGPAIAAKDAATTVQEGAVDQWIEYYRQQREGPKKEERGRAKNEEERGKVKEESRSANPAAFNPFS